MSLETHLKIQGTALILYEHRHDFPLPTFIEAWKNTEHETWTAPMIIQLVHAYTNLINKKGL